jgi:triosephosphate isomerase
LGSESSQKSVSISLGLVCHHACESRSVFRKDPSINSSHTGATVAVNPWATTSILSNTSHGKLVMHTFLQTFSSVVPYSNMTMLWKNLPSLLFILVFSQSSVLVLAFLPSSSSTSRHHVVHSPSSSSGMGIMTSTPEGWSLLSSLLSSYLDSLGTSTPSDVPTTSNVAGSSSISSVISPSSSSSSSSLSTGTTFRMPIVAGNWKLNPNSLGEATNLLKLLAANFHNHRLANSHNDGSPSSSSSSSMITTPQVVIFPPSPFLMLAIEILDGTGIQVGAQNCGVQPGPGAFTGEISPSIIRSLGCDFVMVGHSERRTIYKESDKEINKKIHLCLDEPNLKIILCVGETESEYENKLLRSVVDMQLKNCLKGVNGRDVLDRIVIAYEPVWSIGTGKAATPDQANTAHTVVRDTLAEMFGPDIAEQVRVQYGGSVNPDNIQQLMGMSQVDGVLVGGASLVADSFTRIVDGGSIMSTTSLFLSPTKPYSYTIPPPSRPREFTAREIITTKNVLGESPIWSVRDSCLYWISAPEEEVWCWNMIDEPYRRLMGTTLGCVVLKEGEVGSLVLGGERAILDVTMTPTTDDFATGPRVLCDRPDLASATRPNDGRVDRQGRFVFGGYNNYHRAGSSEGSNNASLYRLNHFLQYEKLLDYDFRVSNCICFPEDGETMFFCDTPTRKVYQFDYPKDSNGFGGAKLTNRKLIWTVPPDLPGGPDGATVDADGCIWIAMSGAGRVVRVVPWTQQVDYVVHLPVKSPTSCTFGGADLDELFITTRGPDGGGLYRVKMPFGIHGLPEPEYKIDRLHET